jgi:hypothetical protein
MATTAVRGGNRQRALQLGLVVAAVAAVVVADRTAAALLAADPSLAARRLHAVLLLGGRVAGGWAVGMAFRLQLARSAKPDEQLRLLLGVPAGFLCAWPVVLTFLPAWLRGALPSWLTAGPLLEVQPFVAVVFGLVLALSVRRARG